MIKELMNRDWQFRENTESWPNEPTQVKNIDLPHDFIITKPRSPNAAGSTSNGFFGEGQGTYRKRFDIPDNWVGKQVILDIDGAYMNAEISLNGELLGLHPYGYTPYLVDLTANLRSKPPIKHAAIVAPDLEIPGITASPWAIPTRNPLP